MNRLLSASVLPLLTALSVAGSAAAWSEAPAGTDAVPPSATAPDNDLVVAKVGEDEITFGQISSMMNSSAVVGVSVPALGSPERQGVAIILLDKIISADLLYLDALAHGTDKDSDYRRALQTFADGALAALYRRQALRAELEVSDEEIDAKGGAKLSADERLALRAALRKQKLDAQEEHLREKIRAGVDIHIERPQLEPEGDDVREDGAVVAKVGKEPITWGEVKAPLLAESKRAAMSGGRLDPVEARLGVLDQVIDTRIMAELGRAAGLEQDPAYQARVGEYRKTHLINRYRNQLIRTMEPSEEEIAAYYSANRHRIAVREERKIQMVVLGSEEQAREVKQKINDGEVTIYEAARDYSIDPNAKKDLGEMGWVAKGTGFPALDELTFSLKPGELGGPVKSPAGWHLVRVENERAAQFQSLDDKSKRTARRNILRDRLSKYLTDLRLRSFPVEIYQERINAAFKQEVAWIAALEQKAKAPDSLTQQRVEEMQKLLKPQ